jgi:hypothetical protein
MSVLPPRQSRRDPNQREPDSPEPRLPQVMTAARSVHCHDPEHQPHNDGQPHQYQTQGAVAMIISVWQLIPSDDAFLRLMLLSDENPENFSA